ncbi:hypothetical protein HHI36_002173 [Cryptolaemus montrouzieri]|uniref:Uncharacterized protein n=1 Tax=Cryptolaemus montrouzieri TaxID=559131 RepID=A0ABD2PA49_9CUCU
MEKQPDKPEDFTNEPLPSMSEPMKIQDAVASTSVTPLVQPIITASKSKAQKQRSRQSTQRGKKVKLLRLSIWHQLFRLSIYKSDDDDDI